MAKAAVIKFTENLAAEADHAGVQVFSVHPGLIPIGLTERALADGAAPGSAKARVHAWIRTELQAGRSADPALAAALITRLAAGHADRLSGCHLSVHDDLDAILASPDDHCACYQLRRWGTRTSFSPRRLHRDDPAGLPVRLRPGAGDQLVRLAPLIRPLVELHWTRMVATINKVATEEQDLHRHLFGRGRLTPPKALREGLADLQARRCFYCRKPFRRAPDADHFIPRVRCGIDAVENLVLADSACNNDKRDLLPASPLVDAWAGRNLEHEGALAQPASSCGWDSDAPGTLAVARSIYRHLPPGQLAFWLGTGRVDITHIRPGIVIDIA